MDDEPGYRPVSPGRGPGCFAAVGFAAFMLLPALMLATLADCLVETPCRQGGVDVGAAFLLLLLAPAALFGFAVRSVVRWWAAGPSSGRGRPPVWAFAAIALLLAAAAWLAVGEGLGWFFF